MLSLEDTESRLKPREMSKWHLTLEMEMPEITVKKTNTRKTRLRL